MKYSQLIKNARGNFKCNTRTLMKQKNLKTLDLTKHFYNGKSLTYKQQSAKERQMRRILSTEGNADSSNRKRITIEEFLIVAEFLGLKDPMDLFLDRAEFDAKHLIA